MAENSGKKRLVVGLVAAAVLVVGAAGALYAMRGGAFQGNGAASAEKSGLARYARGGLTALETPADLVVAPDQVFTDGEGEEVTFADFEGRVVVVNLWAMWCAPCRTEMPTLAALQRGYAEDQMLVLPVNVDTGDEAVADAVSFLDLHEPLPFYSDRSFRLPFVFPGAGKMPQTILLDRQGRVRAWMAGEADWNSAEARALVDALLAEEA
ncbi:MAG: TlpA family protein disulfide reductase [Brevundimonas sp.]